MHLILLWCLLLLSSAAISLSGGAGVLLPGTSSRCVPVHSAPPPVGSLAQRVGALAAQLYRVFGDHGVALSMPTGAGVGGPTSSPPTVLLCDAACTWFSCRQVRASSALWHEILSSYDRPSNVTSAAAIDGTSWVRSTTSKISRRRAVASAAPSSTPTSLPSSLPSVQPSMGPTARSTHLPPTPSGAPSSLPTGLPTVVPSQLPSVMPSQLPSRLPSTMPTTMPSVGTGSSSPSSSPSGAPTATPSYAPSARPTGTPTPAPTHSPAPTSQPSTFASAHSAVEWNNSLVLRQIVPQSPSGAFSGGLFNATSSQQCQLEQAASQNSTATGVYRVLRASVAELLVAALGLTGSAAARVSHRDVNLRCPPRITEVESTTARRRLTAGAAVLTVSLEVNFTVVLRELQSGCSGSTAALDECAAAAMAAFVGAMNNATGISGGSFLQRFVANIVRSGLNVTAISADDLVAEPVTGWGAHGAYYVYAATDAPTPAPTIPPKVYEVHVFYIVGGAVGGFLLVAVLVYCCCTGTHPNKRKINAIVITDIDL